MYAAFLNVLMNSRMEKNQIEELPIPENPDFETARCSGLGEFTAKSPNLSETAGDRPVNTFICLWLNTEKTALTMGQSPIPQSFGSGRERPSSMWNSSLFQRLAKKPIIP